MKWYGREPWNADIRTARESKYDQLSEEGPDGNREYSNGTYGQSDYTVRSNDDGYFDVYIRSDSEKEHSHDAIDKDGNFVANYHDYLLDVLSKEELIFLSKQLKDECKKNTKKYVKIL